MPVYQQNTRRNIGISDPDILEYIKKANNISMEQSGISTKSDIIGEINTLNSHIKDQKWRVFENEGQFKKLSIEISDYNNLKSPKSQQTPINTYHKGRVVINPQTYQLQQQVPQSKKTLQNTKQMQILQKTADLIERNKEDNESFFQGSSTPLKMIANARHRKVTSEFNVKSIMANKLLPNGQIQANCAHPHLNSMIEAQLQSQITQNLLKNNNQPRFQSPRMKKHKQEIPLHIKAFENQEKFLKIKLEQKKNISQRQMNNSKISGSKLELHSHESRNHKHAHSPEKNGAKHSMSMLSSYPMTEQKDKIQEKILSVDHSAASLPRMVENKTMEIKMKQQSQQSNYNDDRKQNIQVTRKRIKLKEFETSQTDSYDNESSDDQISLSKSQNQARTDSQHERHTMDISKSKYEGKGLSKRNSIRIKLIAKDDKKGKLKNNCRVLTNNNSKESYKVDFSKLTIDETNQSYLSIIGLNGHINKVLQSPRNQRETSQKMLMQQNINLQQQRQTLQQTMRGRQNHPQYFMTFQQNEIKNEPQIMPQISSQSKHVNLPKNVIVSQMNSTCQEENMDEFHKFSMFNNFAYQNIVNQNPSQLFRKGQNIQQSKIDQSDTIFKHNLITQCQHKKQQILRKLQHQHHHKVLQPTIITSPEQTQNQKQFPPLHIGEEQLFDYHNQPNKTKYQFQQGIVAKMQQNKLPSIQSQIDKSENIQYQKLFQQYLMNQEKWIQVLQSQLGLQRPENVSAMVNKGGHKGQQHHQQGQQHNPYLHQGNELDIPNADQSFWQKLLAQTNEYQGQQAQSNRIPQNRAQQSSKNASIERVNNQIAHNQQTQQQNMFMNGLCGYSLNSIIQTFQDTKIQQDSQSNVEESRGSQSTTIEDQIKHYHQNFQKEQLRIRREHRKIAVQTHQNIALEQARQKQNKSPLLKVVKQIPPEIPSTNIKIYHKFDNSLHFNHKTNIVIRNINAVIRLIFKNTKEQTAITAINPGNSIHQMQTYIDDHRIKEIQKISNTMKVTIPRRFDSRTAIREYIQSREFITAMKQSINLQLFNVINNSNGTIDLINNKQQKITSFYNKKELLKRQEREFYQARDQVTSNFAASTPRYQSPTKKIQPPLSPEKKSKKIISPKKTDKRMKNDNYDDEGSIDKVKTPLKSKKESAKNESRKLQRKADKEAIQKQQQEDEDLKKLIDEKIEEEQYRRMEEELDPMKKEDRIKIEKSLIDQRERLKEKEKLLQFNQKFSIGFGNNYQIVKQVIKHRYWWAPAQNEDFVDANFIWTSWKRDKHIDYLIENGQMDVNQPIKIYGRMDNNKQLTNKKGLFINMREYYNASGINPFDILPLTYLTKYPGDAEFNKFEKQYNRIEQSLKESQTNCKNEIKEYKNSKRRYIIKEMRERYKNYEESQSDDEDELLEYYEDEQIKDIRKKYKGPLNTWIIKPGENTNRGQGINVSRDLVEIRGLISGGRRRDGQECTYIIQKYIDYPLLIHKRKFDFRVYGLVTSINKKLKGYFYEDGYIRTSSREFDLNALDDKFIHLTNDAIQKQAEDFGKFENCNKMSYGDFQRYLNNFHEDLQIDVLKHIVPQMKKLICDTIRATCFKLDSKRLLNSFEILGYDFMLDENFKLSMIEVNTNPCLETESPLLSRIIPELIENTFKIVLDPLFPSPDLQSTKKLLVNELPLEIKYNLIFDEEIDGPVVKKLYQEYNEKNKSFYMLEYSENQEDQIQSDEEESVYEDDD